MIVSKIHRNEKGEIVVALCDKDLLGKVFEEDMMLLDLSSAFYRGKEATKKDISNFFAQQCIINAVGKEAIGFLEKSGLITPLETKKICKIPYCQIVFR